jgi:hypothetical protein
VIILIGFDCWCVTYPDWHARRKRIRHGADGILLQFSTKREPISSLIWPKKTID